MSNPQQWLESPLGKAMLEQECALTAEVLGRMFGLQLVQLGQWGPSGALIEQARTAYASVIADRGDENTVALHSDPAHLALAPTSVDVVVLPHTLELHDSPHQVLREAERVLVGEGRLVVLGFNPMSPWGVRHMLTRGRFPAGAKRLVAEHRLSDWLKLLGFEIERVAWHSYRLPVHNVVPSGEGRLERLRPALRPSMLAGGYLLTARKRVYSMTPVRPVLVPKKAVLGGLVSSIPRQGVAALDKPPSEPRR